MPQKNRTPAEEVGALIKKLRSSRKISQKTLSQDNLLKNVDLTVVTLSNIENGKVKQPKRATLEDILQALHAVEEVSVADRKIILETFGYKDTSSLPNKLDVQNALQAWQPIKASAYPAYLVDYANRIHDWNDAALRFLGLDQHSEKLVGLTVFDLAFSDVFQKQTTDITLINRDEFLLVLTKDIKSEYKAYMEEEWCRHALSHAFAKYPLFQQLWDSVPYEDLAEFKIRVLEPLRISVRNFGILKFKIVGVDLATDHQFRAVQYEPLDRETSEKCFALFG